ncbi:hypothetical protein [Azospirillum sp.]|uniref:hypothetical protein n=1 Tax=Azospirillum sp. TaxID=34012 RepID=UPI003D7263B5
MAGLSAAKRPTELECGPAEAESAMSDKAGGSRRHTLPPILLQRLRLGGDRVKPVRRSSGKGLRDRLAGEAGGGKEAVQAVARAGHPGEAGHEGDDVVGQALGRVRVSGGDEAADLVLSGRAQGVGCAARGVWPAATRLSRARW